MSNLTFPVILDYCGGFQTDSLFESLSDFNPEYEVQVLDNASPCNASRYVTIQNKKNTYFGGGFRDCLSRAADSGAKFLFLMQSDLELIRIPSISHFESIALSDDEVVQVGASITQDSLQTKSYPWMVDQGKGADRPVPLYDPLCCLIRLDFIQSFGGFPASSAGWGYDWEMSSYARFQSKKILVSESALIRHACGPGVSVQVLGPKFNKREEMKTVYTEVYGDYRLLHAWRVARPIEQLYRQFGFPIGESIPKRRLDDIQLRDAIEEMRQNNPRINWTA